MVQRVADCPAWSTCCCIAPQSSFNVHQSSVLRTGPRVSPALSAVASKKLNLQIIATNQRIGLVTEILKIYLETATILSLQRKLSYFPEEV